MELTKRLFLGLLLSTAIAGPLSLAGTETAEARNGGRGGDDKGGDDNGGDDGGDDDKNDDGDDDGRDDDDDKDDDDQDDDSGDDVDQDGPAGSVDINAAKDLVRRKLKGKVVAAKRQDALTGRYYRIKVEMPDGAVKTVTVDARTGAIKGY